MLGQHKWVLLQSLEDRHMSNAEFIIQYIIPLCVTYVIKLCNAPFC